MRFKTCFFVLSFLFIIAAHATDYPPRDSTQKEDETSTSPWKAEGKIGLGFTQNAYGTYWKGGGVNSLALSTEFELNVKYAKKNHEWDTQIGFTYGVIKLGKNKLVKNEDDIQFDTKYSRKLGGKIQFSGLVNLQTRFHDTYKLNPDGTEGELIGNFMAPGLINLSTGLDYKHKEELMVYYSPLNSKLTVLRDTSLSAQYMPPQLRGESFRYELGSYLKIKFKKEIWKNVIFQSKTTFFANHLKNFGAVDVNLESRLILKVNKYLSTNIFTQFIYDEDIQFDIVDEKGNAIGRTGPRSQFQELLKIGLVQKF